MTRNDHNSIYSTSYQAEKIKDEPLKSSLNSFAKKDKSNHSKIKHGDYKVKILEPNQHNADVIYPKSFPLREDIDFIKSNKGYE